jgi:anti-sigma factor RsiW
MNSPEATSLSGEGSVPERSEASAMTHPAIDDQQVIERYVLGQLPPQEVAAFELHFLSCPACLDQLEAVERLHGGLRGVAAEEVASSLGLLALGAWLRRFWAVGALVAALALLPAALLWRSHRRLEREVASARAMTGSVALLHLSPTRTQAAVPDVHLDLATAPAWIVLALDVEGQALGSYRVELTSSAGETLWSADRLEADASAVLAIALPASLFASGDHRLAVTSESTGSSPVTFLIRATRPP